MKFILILFFRIFLFLFELFLRNLLFFIVLLSSTKLKKSELNGKVKQRELNLLQLPPEILTHVASYLSFNKLKNFALVNKKCQQIHRSTVDRRFTKCVDLRKLFYVNEKKLLERVKNLRYKSVNLSLCYYLSPWFITELISRDCVRELDLTECNCTPEVIASVAKLYLTSLNISLSKSWREFFISKENKSVSVLNGLKKLELYHRYRSVLLMIEGSRYVLPHCHQLQRLKLFTPSSLLFDKEDKNQLYELSTPTVSTPVPSLESLVLDFHNYDDLSPYIKIFLDIILHKKKVPLTNIYLGKQTVKALFMGILNHKLISFDNASTLCLSRGKYSILDPSDPNCKIMNARSVMESMRKCTKYKKIYIENSYVFDCRDYVEMFVNLDEISIAELNLYNTGICSRGVFSLLNKISNPGITFLDISIKFWSRVQNDHPRLSNSELMKCLAQLTNLRTLRMLPDMFSHKTEQEEEDIKVLLCEVTKKCKMLTNLHIAALEKRDVCISPEVFSRIKFFKNLRQLSLISFSTSGEKTSVLSEIVENCCKLKCLHVKDLRIDLAGLEGILPRAKQIKRLYLQQTFKLTKTFVDNLSECSRLEKLFLTLSPNEDVEMLKYFAQSLKKFKKLQFLSTSHLDILLKDYFMSAFNEIKAIRPNVFFDNLIEAKIPMAHHHFFRP